MVGHPATHPYLFDALAVDGTPEEFIATLQRAYASADPTAQEVLVLAARIGAILRRNGWIGHGLSITVGEFYPMYWNDLDECGVFGSYPARAPILPNARPPPVATAAIRPAPAATAAQAKAEPLCDAPSATAVAPPQATVVHPSPPKGGPSKRQNPASDVSDPACDEPDRAPPWKLKRTDSFCRCTGQCGSGVCKTAKNAFYRQQCGTVCKIRPDPEGVYCHRCSCVVHECRSPRFKGLWCKTHGKTYSCHGNATYSNQYQSALRYGASWPLELRIVAKLSYALAHMTPTDLVVLVAHKPTTFRPVDVVRLFIAHALKWPRAVAAFMSATADGDLLTTTAQHCSDTARVLAAAWRSTILECSGHQDSTLFTRMNAGLMSAQSGVAVQSQDAGLINKTQHERLGPGRGTRVRLGPRSKEYFVAEEDSEAMASTVQDVTLWLQEAHESYPSLGWHADLPVFLDASLEFARRCRSKAAGGKYGLRGGLSEDNMYMVKSFCRAAYFIRTHQVIQGGLNIRMPVVATAALATAASSSATGGVATAAIDTVCFERIAGWCPDERSYCTALLEWSGAQVRQKFGMDPMMVSCYTCLVGSLKKDKQKVLMEATASDVCDALARDEDQSLGLPEHTRFLMGPRALAAALSDCGSV